MAERLRLGLIKRYLSLRADMLRRSGGRIVLKRMVGVETLRYSGVWVLDFLRDGGESIYISLILVVKRRNGGEIGMAI